MPEHTKKELKEMYRLWQEEVNTPIDKGTRNKLDKFYKAFDEYVAVLVEYGFICGYEYALQMVKEGVYDVRDY